MKIDIGCGPRKRAPDYVGIDICDLEGVDHVVDFENEPFPLKDRSVDHVFSSHCFEHIARPQNLLQQISRVVKVGGQIEIWTPYPHSDDQWLNGHVAGWSWSRWDHIASQERHAYSNCDLHNGFWRWKEACYAIHYPFKQQLDALKIPVGFGIKHMINGVHEWGCYFEYTLDDPGLHRPLETYCHGRGTQRWRVDSSEPVDDDVSEILQPDRAAE